MSEPLRVLIVCTANQCRSPMAEVVARQLLAERGVDAEVVSAGELPDGIREGRPASEGAVRAVAGRGVDLSHHRSRRYTAETISASDLVIVMERRHLPGIIELDRSAAGRAFTLRELARSSREIGPRGSTELSDWLSILAAKRHPAAVFGLDRSDDTPDPMGGSRRAYRVALGEIVEHLTTFTDLAFGPPRSTAP